jgi:hypothetical protein
MKEFTKEMLSDLHNAHDGVRGTIYYHTYEMEFECKFNGRWKYMGHSIPYTTGKIKTIGLQTYIMIDRDGIPTRFCVNCNVKELLGI